MSQSWVLQKGNIKKLWMASIIILLLLVLSQLLFPISGHFEVEKWLGFGAWFGFISCIVMILFAKILGILIKRSDNYYDNNKGSG